MDVKFHAALCESRQCLLGGVLRVLPRRTVRPMLASGQTAAYFTGTRHFVNIVEGGGMYGFDGICRLCARIEEAFLTARDPRNYIQQKGLGCESCL